MQQWEYQVISSRVNHQHFKDEYDKAIKEAKENDVNLEVIDKWVGEENLLNEMGAVGFELVQIIGDFKEDRKYYFKRAADSSPLPVTVVDVEPFSCWTSSVPVSLLEAIETY